jgi:dTDP-4-amino-4,6-dideoxygalactose transaminase
MFHPNLNLHPSSAECRRTQLRRLEELVRRKSTIEAKIAEEVQELNELYAAAREGMRELMMQKISGSS